MVERRPYKANVGSSILSSRTILIKAITLFILFFIPLNLSASQITFDEYYGINDSISNSFAYHLTYQKEDFSLGAVAVTSQLYSAEDGYYLIPQNFAARVNGGLNRENWDLNLGILYWSQTNNAFYHKISYEISLGFYINDIEFRFSQYTDQYQQSKNFNLFLFYFYLEF